MTHADEDGSRYAAFFHERDAWTEYWDIYHLETNGRFYRGDGDERGLLSLFVPGPTGSPPIFAASKRRALGLDLADEFSHLAAQEPVASAALELDDLVCRVVRSQFGDPGEASVRMDYLRAIHRCTTDTLPAATERASRVKTEPSLRKQASGWHRREASGSQWRRWPEGFRAPPTADSPAFWPKRAASRRGPDAGHFATLGDQDGGGAGFHGGECLAQAVMDSTDGDLAVTRC